MKRNNVYLLSCLLGLLCCGGLAVAEESLPPPVEDLTTSGRGTDLDGSGGLSSGADDMPLVGSGVQVGRAPDNNANVVAETTPVASAPITNTASYADLPLEQRVLRLERQLDNFVNMNLPQQVADLQQQLAGMRGQLATATHTIETLSAQQKQFYQDLAAQIASLKQQSVTAAVPPPSKVSPVSTATKTAAVSSSVTQTGETAAETEVYQDAFQALTGRAYAQAKRGFTAYLKQYPKGSYAANAAYWLGEVNVAQHDQAGALAAFQKVLTQYATSPKVADAKLKIALIHLEQGKTTQGKQELQAVKKQYPGSTAAQLASIRLQTLALPQ